MAQNVAEAVKTRSATLFEKLSSNLAVSNVVMALVGRVVIDAAQMSKPIEGVTIENPIWNGRSLKARVSYNTLSLSSSMGIWSGSGDLLQYASARAGHLGRALERNAGMLKFFSSLCAQLERFCDDKGIDFKDLKIEKAYITPDHVIVLNMQKQHFGVWQR